MTSGTDSSIHRDSSVHQDSGVHQAGTIPQQRTAADAYRVSADQLRRARLVVAHNSAGSDDLNELLDMLGLISPNPDQLPPVVR